MPEPIFDPGDPLRALALLTRFPAAADNRRPAASVWAWPLAGIAVGLAAGAVAALAFALGLGAAETAALALAAEIAVTGALHEDGLADSADGFWGGATPERRLAIMRDSRIGTYGVLALVVALLLRWSALESLFAAGWTWAPLIAAASISRVLPAALLRALPNARGDGLAASTGRPERRTVAAAAGLALLAALLTCGAGALPAAFVAALGGLGVARLATAKIGGQTGDVLGAAQQVAEIGALLALAAWAV